MCCLCQNNCMPRQVHSLGNTQLDSLQHRLGGPCAVQPLPPPPKHHLHHPPAPAQAPSTSLAAAPSHKQHQVSSHLPTDKSVHPAPSTISKQSPSYLRHELGTAESACWPCACTISKPPSTSPNQVGCVVELTQTIARSNITTRYKAVGSRTRQHHSTLCR
jgi:hypothetical protein